MDAAWRQVAVQTWLAGNTWLNRNIRYLMNTTGFTKCELLALVRLVTNEGLAERLFLTNHILIGFVDTALLIPEANVPICSGKCNQGGFFCLSLSCDLVFQRPAGIRLGIADIVSPRTKFVRLSQVYLCQI